MIIGTPCRKLNGQNSQRGSFTAAQASADWPTRTQGCDVAAADLLCFALLNPHSAIIQRLPLSFLYSYSYATLLCSFALPVQEAAVQEKDDPGI